MAPVSNNNWETWLNNHATRKVYDANPTKVVKLLTGSSDSAGFDHLATNKNLVLISRAILGKKIQATFHHSIVGIPIMIDDVHYVARAGMKFGIGIEFQLDTLFRKTALKAVPAILDMMKVKSDDEFHALSAVTTATKKKIDCFAVLTPSLAEAIQSSNMTPSSVFIKIVEQIKVSMPVPAETATSTEETSRSTRASSASSGSSTTTPRTTAT